MNAITFIKQHGVEKARKVVSYAINKALLAQGYYPKINKFFSVVDGVSHIYSEATNQFLQYAHEDYVTVNLVDISDLKRLVESVDQINALGGIDEAKKLLGRINKHGSRYAELFERPALEQAIADYEAIYLEQVK